MKPGLAYAFVVAIAMLALIVLVQQRKLAAERNVNSALRGDARARTTAHYTETSQLLKQIRELRSENDRLRRDLEGMRDRTPARTLTESP